MKKLVFRVTDMHCVNCAMRLQELEDTLPGIQQVDASYRQEKMTVTLDEDRVTVEQIISAVKEIGYIAILEA